MGVMMYDANMKHTESIDTIETKIRNVPKDDWKDFLEYARLNKTSGNKLLIDYIVKTAEKSRQEREKHLLAELEIIRQKK